MDDNDSITSTRTLLLTLKVAIDQLTQYAHGPQFDTDGQVLPPGHIQFLPFDEVSKSDTDKFCAAVEKCLFHGIKIKEFYGVMPFWVPPLSSFYIVGLLY